MGDKSTTHPSFGVISIHRNSGGGDRLVGSEVRHQHYFTLQIKEAERYEDGGEVRFYERKMLAEVALTANQLVDLITQTNVSSATPCTIRYINGADRPLPPQEPSRMDVAYGYGKTRIDEDLEKAYEKAGAIKDLLAKSKIDKKTLTAVSNLLEGMTLNLSENAKFYVERISKAREKSIQVAKTEIESFISATVRELGVKSLKDLGRLIGE